MRNALHFILILVMIAPMPVLAQQLPEAPCAPAAPHTPATVVSIDLSVLAALAETSKLAALHHIQELTPQAPHHPTAFDAERRKTLDKTFKVSPADLLAIDNRFGKVQVNTWARNEMRVKVDVIVRASNESKAQEILDNIRITEVREGSAYFFKTDMAPMRISGNTQKSFEINYTIFMPADNPLSVNNTYGDVLLPDLKGKADITVKYGSLKSGRLGSNDNRVKLSYGSGNCAFINGGNLQVAYADFNLAGANNLQGTSKFSDFEVGYLSQEMTLEVKYGSFKVGQVSKGMRRISLDSGFSPVVLGFEENASFTFDVRLQFADLKVDQSLVKINSLEKNHTSAQYKGTYGDTASKSTVTIISRYGDVKFTR